ncbi:MAG: tetratricopeptide repeat protein [Bacteroidetes bacterium]|nr:tetratricopeptide repeat protein [Bacteroidota bacterium]
MTANHHLLYRLAELMLGHEQHVLPVDLLFDDEHIGDVVKSTQVDSPYQQMLLEGVLTESVRDEKLFVSFTVEGYFHFVLGDVIFNLSNEKDHTYFIELLQDNQLNGIKEGVEQCLIRATRGGQYEAIFKLIDSGETEICIIPLATACGIGKVHEILKELIEHESDEDYAIVNEVISVFKTNGKLSLVQEVFCFFVEFFKTINIDDQYFNRQKLKLHLLNTLDEESFISLINSINKENSCFESFNSFKRLVLLFEINTSIVDRGLLHLAHQFAKQFELYQVDLNFITGNYYNLIYPLLELGLFELAEDCYLKCEPLNKENAIFLNWSGFIYQSWYELKSGEALHIAKGLELYQLSSELLDRQYGKYSIQKYQNLENIGYTYSLLKDYERSITFLNQAIDIVAKTYQAKIVYPLGNLYEMLGVTFNAVGRYKEALELTFLSDQCKLLQISTDSPEMAWNHFDRSEIYLNLGDKEKAIEEMMSAYNIRQKSLGEENGLTIQTKEALNQLIKA